MSRGAKSALPVELAEQRMASAVPVQLGNGSRVNEVMACAVAVGSEGWQGKNIGLTRGLSRGWHRQCLEFTKVAGAAHWIDKGAKEVKALAVPVQQYLCS